MVGIYLFFLSEHFFNRYRYNENGINIKQSGGLRTVVVAGHNNEPYKSTVL
jgi:hypothetical protein